MSNNLIGIEIGSSRMKLAEVRDGKVIHFITYDLPEGTMRGREILAWDALADELKKAVAAGGFTSKKCAIAIPDEETHLRRLSMPPMNDQQLLVNLPYEYHELIADNKDNYIYDYSLINIKRDPENQNNNTNALEIEILGAAVSKELISKYKDLFKRAGLKLVAARPRTLALSSYMKAKIPEFMTKDTAVIDFGYTASQIDIFRNGVYEVTRTIDVGVAAIIKAAAEALNKDPHIAKESLKVNTDDVQMKESVINVYDSVAVEVMRALNYFSFENPDNTLETLYYFGGGSWIQPFVIDVVQDLSLKATALSAYDQENKNAVIDGATAIGLCLG
ncbi:MAG: pilus assembly protein PilM [Lachnospiraceae bacterium]|nr:pilus assembly protein PilM [Lachnospiraceae bacterium]MDD7702288.1 pilus assembly protein PilM [Lachnospiraceae bacterium]MDY3301583.1 pilus assembly protein PilM [Lachnospiraceae bacterium]MEE3379025.1 pilus assembly protein PilM [Lachnospiraceae bacterium]MEE3433729.1 pilus assembly protein PilM [Lachnospiraceae bacterium]